MPQVNTEGVHQRKAASQPRPVQYERIPSAAQAEWTAWLGSAPPAGEHPLGAPRFGRSVEILRSVGFGLYFFTSCLFIHLAQLLGAPLYFVSKDWFYAYMALTKQYFGLLATTMTQWWSPTIIRVSGDKSMAGLIKQDAAGMLSMNLGERVVLMANHQIYTDWLYLWWISYTNTPPMHGHIYIILKESLKYIPFLGPGMMFYGFIFMARKWASDKPRLQHRLNQLKGKHRGPLSGKGDLDPMWLLIFPEGTNLSANTRKRSVAWSQKSGKPDMKHLLLPRSTGMYFCLEELRNTVDWVYDCTIGYEGTPPDGYAQDFFTLRSTFLQGRPPKSVSLHWRRFAVSSIPLDSQDSFENWIEDRWREKDKLLDQFYTTGKFPADIQAKLEKDTTDSGYIETAVQLRNPLEVFQPWAVVVTFALIINIGFKLARQFGW